jgi:hypothetical protein
LIGWPWFSKFVNTACLCFFPDTCVSRPDTYLCVSPGHVFVRHVSLWSGWHLSRKSTETRGPQCNGRKQRDIALQGMNAVSYSGLACVFQKYCMHCIYADCSVWLDTNPSIRHRTLIYKINRWTLLRATKNIMLPRLQGIICSWPWYLLR